MSQIGEVCQADDIASALCMGNEYFPYLLMLIVDLWSGQLDEALSRLRCRWPQARYVVMVDDERDFLIAETVGADKVLYQGCRVGNLIEAITHARVMSLQLVIYFIPRRMYMRTIRQGNRGWSRQFVGGISLAVFVLLVGFVTLKQQVLPTKAAGMLTQTAFTNGISVTPNKSAYAPSEKVSMTVNGSGDLTNIEVRIAPARLNIIQPPFDETTTIPGAYNSATKSWSVTNWSLPAIDGEYILMVNAYQSNGQFCAGNPAYACAGCKTGTMAGSGITAGVESCNGSHKTIAVDSKVGVIGAYDMMQYWNLAPGSYWKYSGTNYPKSVNFNTRVAVEENITFNGIGPLTPLRITKDKPEGYIRANVDSNIRLFLSYFSMGQRWSGDPSNPSMGRPFAINYKMPGTANPLAALGAVYNSSGPGKPPFGRSMSTYVGNEWMDFVNVYFAPHYFSKRYVNPGLTFTGVDIINNDLTDILQAGYLPYYYNSNTDNQSSSERFIYNSIYTVTPAELPGYSNALRLTLLEAGYPLNEGRWYVREDWYFAKNIGRVKVAWRNCRDVSHPDCPNLNNLASNLGPMTAPDVKMELTNYYVGGPLTISVATNNPKCTPKSGSWTLKANTQQGQPYTGYLEAKNCIGTGCTVPAGDGFKWGYGGSTYIWVQDGQAVVNMAQLSTCNSGWRTAQFRPWIETSPADAQKEVTGSKTQLPWSTSTTWYVGQ